jgi:DNA-binding NarL/FixJ family response regulator
MLPAVAISGGQRRIRLDDLSAFTAAHEIPMDDETAAAESTARSVLLVDDDPVFATYLRQIIVAAEPDIQVEWASNGFEAGQLTASFRPHLYVIDIYMPRVDGIELCRRLKSSETTAAAEVVILSSSLTEENIAAVQVAGADRWIEKSSSSEQILTALRIGPAP